MAVPTVLLVNRHHSAHVKLRNQIFFDSFFSLVVVDDQGASQDVSPADASQMQGLPASLDDDKKS